MAPYPSVYEIEEMFSHRGHPSIFETYLADNLDVTVVGQDFHIAGQYRDKKAFHEGIYSRVAAALDQSTIRVEVMRVIGDGESAWAVIESKCTAMSKYGELCSFCEGLFGCSLWYCCCFDGVTRLTSEWQCNRETLYLGIL